MRIYIIAQVAIYAVLLVAILLFTGLAGWLVTHGMVWFAPHPGNETGNGTRFLTPALLTPVPPRPVPSVLQTLAPLPEDTVGEVAAGTTPAVSLTPTPTEPSVLPLGDTYRYGFAGSAIETSVYRYEYLDRYSWWDPDWGRFYPEIPAAGNRFLVIFLHLVNTGSQAQWIPSADAIAACDPDGTCYDHRPYRNSTGYNDFQNQTFASEYQWVRELGVNDRDYEYIRENSFMGEQGGGFIWPGTSNAIDGYLLYEVPRNLTPGNTTISIWFNNVSQSSWVLQPARVAGGLPPFSAFSPSLSSGPWPLLVSFTDMSSGSPASWWWDFGDNETSNEESPRHVYWYPGSYTVTLTVRNIHGSNMTTVKDGVVVRGGPPQNSTHAVTFRTNRPGYISDGSYLTFANLGLPGEIHLNGTSRDLPSPSIIGLLFNGDGDGEVGIHGRRFENLTYGNLTLYVNGSEVDRGRADGILVPECSNFSTAFTYSLPVSDGMVYLSWDELVVLDGGDYSGYTIRGLGLDEGGSLSVQVGANRTLIAGNASEYQMPDLTIGGV